MDLLNSCIGMLRVKVPLAETLLLEMMDSQVDDQENLLDELI
jgi:hypothetical protein